MGNEKKFSGDTVLDDAYSKLLTRQEFGRRFRALLREDAKSSEFEKLVLLALAGEYEASSNRNEAKTLELIGKFKAMWKDHVESDVNVTNVEEILRTVHEIRREGKA